MVLAVAALPGAAVGLLQELYRGEDRETDGQIDGQADGQTDGQTDGALDGTGDGEPGEPTRPAGAGPFWAAPDR